MAESSVQVFDNVEFGEIRVLTDNSGDAWFVAMDVCDALNIRTSSIRSILDEDEVSTTNDNSIDIGGGKSPLIVSEAGLYALVLKSRKPEAKAFKRWVTHDVLPSIRKHGMYATPSSIEKMLRDPDTMIETLKALKAERMRSQALLEDNARLLPKATAFDVQIEASGTMSITEAARYLHQLDKTVTRTRLFALLRADRLICQQGNAPTKKGIERGYFVQMLTVRADGKANDPYARMTRKGYDYCVTHYLREAVLA